MIFAVYKVDRLRGIFNFSFDSIFFFFFGQIYVLYNHNGLQFTCNTGDTWDTGLELKDARSLEGKLWQT